MAIKINPKYTQAAKNTLRHPIRTTANAVGEAGSALILGTGKRMVKKTNPNIGNFYTGYRESALGTAVGIGASVAITAGYMFPLGEGGPLQQMRLEPKLGEVSYTGAPPVMLADGVGQTTNAPTLNASGDVVLGLHNGRRG